MPANVQTYIGRESAWHKLGVVTGQYFTWQDALRDGGLDFQVFKSQLKDGLNRPVPAWGTFRWNTPDVAAKRPEASIFLGTVGQDYKVIPHASGFELVDALVASTDGAHYETAGVLGQGEVVWGCADLNLSTSILGDEHKHYLLFHTSHDGSYSYEFRDCDTRVVCQNTLNCALSEKTRNKLKIRHTKSAPERIIEAKSALELYRNDVATLQYKLETMARRSVQRDTVTVLMDKLFPVKTKEDGSQESSTRRNNILAGILTRFESNDGNAIPGIRGTAYNLLNGVTEWVDHDRATETQSALFGSGDKLKLVAFSTLLGLVPSMPEMAVVRR